MLIAGAGGFARESLELLQQIHYENEIFFYDDVNPSNTEVYNVYKVLKKDSDVKDLFQDRPEFVLGVGDVVARLYLYERMINLGGKAISLVSPFAQIGKNKILIEEGTVIATGSILTTNISIGKGCLINLNCTIGHDTSIGKFSVLSPGVHVSGNCVLEDCCFIGTGAVLLPGIKVGYRAIIGAGSVVNRNVPAHSTVVGIPAKLIKNRK